MKRKNQGKRTTTSVASAAASMQSPDADYGGGGPTSSPKHGRSRAKSDMLSKVALLFVLLPHMAQTKYARGKEFFSTFSLLFFHRDEMYMSKLLQQRETPPFEPYFFAFLAWLIRVFLTCAPVHLNISSFLLFYVLGSFMSFPLEGHQVKPKGRRL